MAAQIQCGLDVGSQTIKVVELKKEEGKIRILALGTHPVPPGGLISENQLDQEAVSTEIKKLFGEVKITTRDVNSALPESSVFAHVIEVPQVSEEELSEALRWEGEQYIPLPLSEVYLDFSVIKKPQNKSEKMTVLLVAAPLRMIEKYTKIIEGAGLNLLSLETEILAVSRALGSQLPPEKTLLVVHLGAATTDFSIVRGGIIFFTRSISTGGEALARAVAQEFGFTLAQAEEYKRTYGLEKDKLEGKVLGVIKPLVDTIIEETKRAITFFEDKNPDEKIGSLILSGGTAKLPGMVSYLAENTGIETQVANPWITFTVDPKVISAFAEDGPIFAVATGLAMKETV